MKIVLDMNLSPTWVSYLSKKGYDVIHWRDVGVITATDSEIMQWARNNQYVVFTHDLDFSALLASTNAKAPSVIQLRIEEIRPGYVGELVVKALEKATSEINAGALITIEPRKNRIRLLPFSK